MLRRCSDEPRYGILPSPPGTVTTSLVALAVAAPLGTVIATALPEFASPRVREIVKPFLELLVVSRPSFMAILR